MINLEQVKLLETKVARAIEYIEQLTGENAAQRQKEAELQAQLVSYQQRIDELEVLVMRLREDQGRIEDSILAALDKLNQFDDTIEKSLNDKAAATGKADRAAAKEPLKPVPEPVVALGAANPGEEKICFEIPETDSGDDVLDPLETLEAEPPKKSGELLDIF